MESNGLITSTMEAGPFGPERRMYSLGKKGESYLRDALKDAIETIMHFYDGYRHSIVGHMEQYIEELKPPKIEGRILFAAISEFSERDIQIVELISKRRRGRPIDIMGTIELPEHTSIPYRSLKGDILKVPIGDNSFSEVWIFGIPERKDIPNAISECKRILANGGLLRMMSPFVFFNPPSSPTLSEFIRVTAIHLFPELGFYEGQEVGAVIESFFSTCGASEAFPGYVLFWAEKE